MLHVLTCDPWSGCVNISQQERVLGENLKSESSRVDIFEGLGEGIPLNMKVSLFKFEILKPHDDTVKQGNRQMREINLNIEMTLQRRM